MQNIGKNLVIGLFVAGVIGALGYSIWNKQKDNASKEQAAQIQSQKVVLNGIITSEKESFFKDARVQKIFQDNNMEVNYERWTSAKIAQAQNISDFGKYNDFVFPPGVQTTDKVKQNIKGAQAYNIFYSPMVIDTWKPIVNILAANGMVQNKTGYQTLNMEKFFTLMQNKVKWKDLKQSDEYPVNKTVLIYTSDARYSNSSKMFIALAGYVYNNNEVVTNEAQSDKVISEIKKLMEAQGHRESSSTNLLTDYTSIGMGKTPLVFGYENEFLEYAVKNKGISKDMALLYPSPTLFTKHTMITFNDKAQKLTDLLSNNEEIKKIAAEYGFRFAGNNKLVEQAKAVGVQVPETVVEVVDPPSFDILEKMVNEVETK